MVGEHHVQQDGAFVSIAAEAWQVFGDPFSRRSAKLRSKWHWHDCAAARVDLQVPSRVARRVLAVAARMADAAPPLLQIFSARWTVAPSSPRTWRHRQVPLLPVRRGCPRLWRASAGTCPSSRASEAWRTYSELFIRCATASMREIVAYHQTEQGAGVNDQGSRSALSRAFGDMSDGGRLESFTMPGFGYGLLAAGLDEHFLLQYFTVAHASRVGHGSRPVIARRPHCCGAALPRAGRHDGATVPQMDAALRASDHAHCGWARLCRGSGWPRAGRRQSRRPVQATAVCP